MSNFLYGAEIALAITLIVIFLLQAKGGGLSSVFGGGGGGGPSFRTKRGIERTLFRLGIILTVIFVALCAFSVYLKGGL